MPDLQTQGPQPTLQIDSAESKIQTVQTQTERKYELSVYSWNVNGITSLVPSTESTITQFFSPVGKKSKETVPDPKQPTLRSYLRRWNWPGIVCLQEVKIAFSDNKTQDLVRRAANLSAGGDSDAEYDAYFCLPRDKYNAIGFGGRVHGVCTLIRRDLSDARIKTVDWDLEGRVLLCELQHHQLTVINVYAVNGTDYDYRDSSTGKVIGTRHDRKRTFHTLLAAEVERYEKQGWQVVVAGDINISRTAIDSYPDLRLGKEHVQNRADFHKKFIDGLGMLDTFRLLHADRPKYTYRPRNKPWNAGMDRVDMILVTEALENKVAEADILDIEADRGPSDHVPLFMKLRSGQSNS